MRITVIPFGKIIWRISKSTYVKVYVKVTSTLLIMTTTLSSIILPVHSKVSNTCGRSYIIIILQMRGLNLSRERLMSKLTQQAGVSVAETQACLSPEPMLSVAALSCLRLNSEACSRATDRCS